MARLCGVIAAAATPLRPDLSIDTDKLVAHCRWLLDAGGCDGINLLGTTGEATSFSVEQRLAAMKVVAASGVTLTKMMVGTGASALEDAARLTAAAANLGFAGALLLPPFYYKGIDADSLVDYVGAVLAKAGTETLPVYLYHIPQNTGVPFPIEVVARLRDRHKDLLIGLKDSSGVIAYSRELAQRLPGFDVFPSSEGSLVESRASGFAGCISATTNVNGAIARPGWLEPETETGRNAVAEAVAIREALSRFPLVASVKWALSDLKRDASWARPNPPLRALSSAEQEALRAALATTAYRRLASS